MDEPREDHTPEDLGPVEESLRAMRPEVSELELDRVKMQVKGRLARGRAPRAKGVPLRARGLMGTVLAMGVLLLGAAATIAVTKQFSSDKQNVSTAQYGNGKGCGNPNKDKPRRSECKRQCPKAKKDKKRKGCKIKGTSANDYARGTRYPDTFRGGSGSDRINARGGGKDKVYCGPGRDVAYVDWNDRVSKDCEVVRRKPKPKSANGGKKK